MSEISYQIVLGAAPGRKSRQELNSEAENLPDHQKLKNSEKFENSHKMHSPVNFSTFKINFRSADAANHMNRDPGGEIGMTRRAYLYASNFEY